MAFPSLRGALAPLAVLLQLSAPPPAYAQSATLEGFVLGSAGGARLGGVLLVVDSGQRARSDGDGAYRLEDLPSGPHRLALVAPGCQITFASVELAAGEVRSLAFEIAFDPAVVSELARRRRSGGKVVSAAEIEKMHAGTLADVVSRVAPALMGTLPSQPGQDVRLRSRSPVGGRGPVAPAVILDGAVLGEAGISHLYDIRPSDVAWMEIHQGASGGWAVGTGGSGGLIRIQTKRGRQMDAPFLEPERCEIPRWSR